MPSRNTAIALWATIRRALAAQANGLPVARRLARDFVPVLRWAGLGFAAVLVFALCNGRVSLSFDWWGNVVQVCAVLGFVVLSLFCAGTGPLMPLYEKAVMIALVYAVVHFTFYSTRTAAYVAQVFTTGWQDKTLQGWDQALGFDWWAYARAVQEVPALMRLQNAAYSYLELPIILLVVLLVLSGRVSAVRDLIYAVFVCALMVALVSVVFPAKGAVASYNAEEVLARFSKSTAIYHIKKIESLRGLAPYSIPWNLPGLVAFPSFHMAVGVLLPWAAWGNRRLFAATLAYSAVMVSATPIFGGHYLVDLIAGVAVAVASIFATRHLLRPWLGFADYDLPDLRSDLQQVERDLAASANR